MPQVYKITYPNGKIYIGSDMTDCLTYFGTVNNELVSKDFDDKEPFPFSITKEVLWESQSVTRSDLVKIEKEFIRKYQANNPKLGYNRWPKW